MNLSSVKFVVLIVCTMFFSSCVVFHTGNVSSGPLLNTGDVYADEASGTSMYVTVFGLGSGKRKALVQEAKTKMYLGRPLQKGEYFSNFTIDIDRKLIFMVGIHKITVSADVLRSGDTSRTTLSKPFLEKTGVAAIKKVQKPAKTPIVKAAAPPIANGDSIYYSFDSRSYKLYVASGIDKQTVMLVAVHEGDRNMLVPLTHTFFLKNKIMDGFKYGDKVNMELKDAYNYSTYTEGTVLGASDDDLLLVKAGNTFYTLPAVKLKKLQ